MILGDLLRNPDQLVITDQRWYCSLGKEKKPFRKMFLFLWMMTKDSLRLKRVFLLLNNQTSFPICDFHVVSALP